MQYEVRKLADYLWELPPTGGMRVPARIYATEKMLPQILADNAAQQAANVTWSARYHEGIASNA